MENERKTYPNRKTKKNQKKKQKKYTKKNPNPKSSGVQAFSPAQWILCRMSLLLVSESSMSESV